MFPSVLPSAVMLLPSNNIGAAAGGCFLLATCHLSLLLGSSPKMDAAMPPLRQDAVKEIQNLHCWCLLVPLANIIGWCLYLRHHCPLALSSSGTVIGACTSSTIVGAATAPGCC